MNILKQEVICFKCGLDRVECSCSTLDIKSPEKQPGADIVNLTAELQRIKSLYSLPFGYFMICDIEAPTDFEDFNKFEYSSIKRTMMRKFHPDKHNGASEADEICKLLNQIFDILTDNSKRATYLEKQIQIGMDYHERTSNKTKYSNNTPSTTNVHVSEPSDTPTPRFDMDETVRTIFKKGTISPEELSRFVLAALHEYTTEQEMELRKGKVKFNIFNKLFFNLMLRFYLYSFKKESPDSKNAIINTVKSLGGIGKIVEIITDAMIKFYNK